MKLFFSETLDHITLKNVTQKLRNVSDKYFDSGLVVRSHEMLYATRGPLRRSMGTVYPVYSYSAGRVSRRPHTNGIGIIHTSHLNSGSINKRRHLTRPGVGIVTARARARARDKNRNLYIIILYSINTGKLKSLRESAHKPVPRDFRRPPPER